MTAHSAVAYRFDAVETTENDPSRPLAKETFSYDAADRLLTANDSARGTDSILKYDAGGRVLTRHTDGTISGSTYTGKTTTFGYDSLDRQQTMSVSPGTGVLRPTSFVYWPSGDQRRMLDPNGVRHEDYYDATGQITDKQRLKGASTVADQAYSYDLDANRTRDEKGSESYNSRDQLVSWTRTGGASSVSYVVNGAGAVVRSTDSSGPDTANTLDGDRLTQATTTPQAGTPVTRSYSYDGFGNLTRIHKTSDGADTTKDVTYLYDAFERLITSKDPSLAPAPTTSSYTYDGLDRRDTQTTGSNTTTYGYIAYSSDVSAISASDGPKQTFDYDAAGNRLGEQVTAPAASAYRTYVTDAQGSVQGLEDPNGTVATANQYRYDPYGNPDATGMSTEAQANPFRFQGFQYDPTANAYNAQAREYRPDIQRFLTQDRYEAAGADLNLATNALTSDRYAFVAGNPTSNIEFDGHCMRLEHTNRCVITGEAANTPAGRKSNGETFAAERNGRSRTHRTGRPTTTVRSSSREWRRIASRRPQPPPRWRR